MSATNGPTEKLWDHKETAAYFGMSQSQLWTLNREGNGPPSFKIGRMRRYDPREVRAWLEEHRHAGASA